jgi:hypothetical protein
VKLTHALAALPFLGILGGSLFANTVEPYVPGLTATTVAENVVRGLNLDMTDDATSRLSRLLVPVVALGGVAFVFGGGQTLVTLPLLG